MATGGDRDTDAAGDTAELLTFEVDSDRSSYYSDGSIYCPHISAIRHALHGDHLYDFYNSYSDDDDVPPLQTISSVEDEEPGYDYKFVCNVPGALVCLICTGVARNAQQVDCCGKIFCRVCLHKLKRSQNKVCPNCRQKRWRNFPDKKSKLYLLVSPPHNYYAYNYGIILPVGVAWFRLFSPTHHHFCAQVLWAQGAQPRRLSQQSFFFIYQLN